MPCACGDCVRANHGQPAVTFPATRFSAGYELHGVAAARYYEAQGKALAWIRQQRRERGV